MVTTKTERNLADNVFLNSESVKSNWSVLLLIVSISFPEQRCNSYAPEPGGPMQSSKTYAELNEL